MKSLRRLFLATALALAGCSAPPEPAPGAGVALLAEAPAREHEVLGRLQVRGDPGANVRYAYDELRKRAAALGADAVIKTEERALSDAAPAPADLPDRPLLGNAYPGPLRDFEPGAFPPAGAAMHVRGRYYVVEGVAIRYVD